MKKSTYYARVGLLFAFFVLCLVSLSAQTTWQTATSLAPNEQKVGAFSSQSGEQWFKIEITRNVIARFGYKSSSAKVQYITLYSVKDGAVAERDSRYCLNSADTLTVNDLAAGTYYLRLNRYNDDGEFVVSYTETEPAMANDAEPNNRYGQSQLLTAGVNATGQMGYAYLPDGSDRDTEDWFKLVIDKNVSARFQYKTDDNLKIQYITLFNEVGDTIETRNSAYCLSTEGSLTVVDLAPGTYYLRINHYNGQGGYDLGYTVTPPVWTDDVVQNDSYDAAEVKILPLGDEVTGHLGYAYEKRDSSRDLQDWYKVDVKHNTAGHFAFKTDGTLRIQYITLCNAVGDTIETRNTRYCLNSADTLVVDDLAAGIYYLRINLYADQGAYTLSYTEVEPALTNDVEPNDDYKHATAFLVPGQEVTGHLGYAYEQRDSSRDLQDWYKVEVKHNTSGHFAFKTDGTLRIQYITLCNAVGDTIETRNTRYCLNSADTLVVDDLAAGIYYLRINLYADQGAYTLSYTEVEPALTNDVEPNDDYKSTTTTLTLGKNLTGHLGYAYEQRDSSRDLQDWYKVEISRDVSARFGFKTDGTLKIQYITLCNAVGDTIETRNTRYCLNTADTLDVSDLTPGTYYLRVNMYAGQGTYTVGYTEVEPIFANDSIANDDFRHTTPLTVEQGVTGHLGYRYLADGSDRDVADWYKVVIDEKQTAKFGFMTDGTLRVQYISLYSEDGDTIRSHSERYCLNTADTLRVDDLEPGTYYLRINHYGGQGAYALGMGSFLHPVVAFEAIQGFDDFSFVNNTLFGDSYQWDFGDGNTSELANPIYRYAGPGVYQVKLKAVNEYGKNELTKTIQARGIQRIESAVGGAGGSSTVMIYGGELKENSIAYLRSASGSEYAATYNHLDNIGELQATFDLKNVTEGKYDIVVRNAGEEDMVLEQGFTVEPAKVAEMWAEIQGRDRALIGRWQTYTLEYGNRGNVDSEARILWLMTPDSPAEIEFLNVITDDLSFYPKSTHELLNDENVHDYLLIDTIINGVQQQMRLYSLMIPILKANSHERIEFRVKSENNFRLSTFITESFVDNNTTIPEMRSPRVMAAAEYSSFEACSAAAFAKFVGGKALGLALDAIPGASCVVDVVVGTGGTVIDAVDGKFTLGSLTKTVASTAWTCAKDFVAPLKAYKLAVAIIDNLIDFKNNYDAVEECKKYKKKNDKDKDVRTVTSFDPNEMIGPDGFGALNCIQKQVMPYTIMFENMKTAAVPAQEVVVLDTLDVSKFDMTTFRFSAFGYGNENFRVVQDGNSFVKNLDLRPAKNVILRVSGVLNPENGVVRWQFITLDPATMDLTEDPDAGFLPPNINQPEGEGFVSFVVAPRSEVKSGDRLENQANIFFDTNKPIMTNLWSNTIDEDAPTSKVANAKAVQTEEGSAVEIEFESNDGDGSGAKFCDLYVSSDNGTFEHKLSNLPVNKKIRLSLPEGSYQFYSLATDSVGLQEAAKNTAEFSVIVSSIGSVTSSDGQLRLYPNPVTDYLTVANIADGTAIRIYDVTGSLVLIEPLSGGKVNVSRLSSGVYMVVVDNQKSKMVKK